MPKMKTKRSAAKRFLMKQSGKIKRRRAFHSHILTKKSQKRKRKIRQGTYVASCDEMRVARMLVG